MGNAIVWAFLHRPTHNLPCHYQTKLWCVLAYTIPMHPEVFLHYFIQCRTRYARLEYHFSLGLFWGLEDWSYNSIRLTSLCKVPLKKSFFSQQFMLLIVGAFIPNLVVNRLLMTALVVWSCWCSCHQTEAKIHKCKYVYFIFGVKSMTKATRHNCV